MNALKRSFGIVLSLLIISYITGCSSPSAYTAPEPATRNAGDWDSVAHYRLTGDGVTGEYGFQYTGDIYRGNDKVLNLTFTKDNQKLHALFVEASMQIIDAQRYYVTTWSTDKLGTAYSFEPEHGNTFKFCITGNNPGLECITMSMKEIKEGK